MPSLSLSVSCISTSHNKKTIFLENERRLVVFIDSHQRRRIKTSGWMVRFASKTLAIGQTLLLSIFLVVFLLYCLTYCKFSLEPIFRFL
jgi:hypothetical protein